MTFFLNQKETSLDRPSSGLTGGLPSTWDSISARMTASNLERGYRNLEDVRRRSDVDVEQAAVVLDRLGSEAVLERLKAAGLAPPVLERLDATMLRHNREALGQIFDMAREASEADPQAWADVMISPEDREQETINRLRAEFQEAQDVLAMSPESLSRDLLAELVSGTINLKTLPFLMLGYGGGVSFFGIMAREAAINVGVETALLPSQFQAAEDLDIPDPDVVRNLAEAAAFGAAFGGGAEALARGLRYAASRREFVPPTVEPLTGEMAMQRMENALAEDAFQEVQQIAQEAVPPPPAPPPGREPLILQPEQRVTTEVLPPAEGAPATGRMDDQSLIAMQENALTEAARIEGEALGGRRYPFLHDLKRAGVRIDPDTPHGQELRQLFGGGQQANRVMPGLLSRKAARGVDENTPDLDNLVASEWEQRFPGISDAAGVDNGYLSRDGVFDLIRREVSGDHAWMHRMIEAQSMRHAASRSALDDWQARSAPQNPEGLFIDRDRMFFDKAEWEVEREIGRMMDEWFETSGHGVRLTEAEKAEIRHVMQKDGGDPELLVERAYEREIDWVSTPRDEVAEDIPFGDAPVAGAASARGPGPVAGEAGGGGAGAGRGGASAGAVQAVIPGAERVQTGVAQRQQAEMAAREQQSKMRRGDQQRIEDDPESLFGGGQSDLFDDVSSPEVRVIHDAIADDTRRFIDEAGDFTVDMGDGKGERSASAVLDDLDAGDRAAARLALCGKAPGGEA